MEKRNKGRRIAFFTGNRAEYGLLYPVIKAASVIKGVETSLIISGAHLSREFGETVREIDTSLVKRVERIPWMSKTGHPETVALGCISMITRRAPEILKRLLPDMIILAGDRFETFAMAISAFYMNVPIAHLFGGDLSQGGHLDDSARHSITKLAHLHFTTNNDSFHRVLSMGEERWRVYNVGTTAVDNSISGEYSSPDELARELKLDLLKPVVIFTQHPVTTEVQAAYAQVKEGLGALKDTGYQTVITYPCNDAGSGLVIKAIREYSSVPTFRIIRNLGWKKYFGLMKVCSCMVGNSSSGIIEAPFFKLPFVHVGTRQAGRLRAGNVIDVPYERKSIAKAVKFAVSNARFRKNLSRLKNPYGDGRAALRIARIIKSVPLGNVLLRKKMAF